MLFCAFLCTAFASLMNPKNLLKQPIRAALIISDLPFFYFFHYSGIKQCSSISEVFCFSFGDLS